MSVNKDFSVVDDFEGNFPNAQKLKVLVEGSSISSAVLENEKVIIIPDSNLVRFVFDQELSSEDEGTLNNIVSNYTAPKRLKIYDYIDINSFSECLDCCPPKDISYDILGLYKKETFVYGDLTEIIYYVERDGDTFSIPIVKEVREYNIVDTVYESRTITISWYYEDETLCSDTKIINKTYDPPKGIQAIERKRNNIMASVKTNLIGYLLLTGEETTKLDAIALAKAFLSDYVSEISKYKEGTSSPLTTKLTNETGFDWLDNEVTQAGNVTIRNLILNELNYPGAT